MKQVFPAQPAAPAVDPLAIVEKVLSIQAKTQPEPSANPLNTMKDTLDLFGQVRDLLKPDAPAAPAVVSSDSMSGWQAFGSTIIQSLPQTLSSLAAVIAAMKPGFTPPVQAAAAPPVVPRPAAFDPYKDPAAAREFVRQQNAATSQPAPTQQQPTSTSSMLYGSASGAQAPANPVGAETAQAGIEQQQIIGLISNALSCLQRGVSGRDFADGIIITSGELMYSGLVNQIQTTTIPVLITLSKTLPGGIGEQVTAYESQFATFISEFLEGPSDWGEEEHDAKDTVDGAAHGHRSAAGRN